MALGKQFENTYWENPETGEAHTWTREDDSAGIRRAAPTYKRGESAERVLSGQDSDISHQGLLFHPATATGTKDDPLVEPEKRREEATRMLGLEGGVDAYKKRLRSETGRKASDRMAANEIDILTNTAVDSSIPTRRMGGIQTSAYLHPRGKEGFAEEYTDTIMIGKHSGSERITVPASTKRVVNTTPSDTPVFNSNFWNWMGRNTNRGDSDVQDDQLLRRMSDPNSGISWHNPETGKVVSGEDAMEEATRRTYGPILEVKSEHGWFTRYDPERHGPVDTSDTENVRFESGREYVGPVQLEDKGFVPNIFPGEAKSSKKYHADNEFELEKRYNYNTDKASVTQMHTRHEPLSATTETVTVPEYTKVVSKDYILPPTLIHEIGHQDDDVMSDSFSHRHREVDTSNWTRHQHWTRNPRSYSSADPMEEGYADGFEDRYGSKATQYEDVLTDPTHPNYDIKSGYGVDSKKWKNNTHRALYVASRVAARSGDGGREQYPSRSEIMESLGHKLPHHTEIGEFENRELGETANAMTLGHMLTTTPSLMNHLKGQGLDSVGRKARSAYIDAKRDHTRRQNGGWVQDSLPGAEDW